MSFRTSALLLCALASISDVVWAQNAIEDCLAIKLDKQRLACFDKAARANIDAQKLAEAASKRAAEEQRIRKEDPNNLKPEQRASAERATKQLNKLLSAAEVGISYREYGTRIIDASGDFKEATKQLPQSGLRIALEQSFAEHISAREIWNAMIQAGDASIFEKVYCDTLRRDYKFEPCRITPGPYSRVTRMSPVSDESKSAVLTAVWAVSRAHLAVAEKLISAGKLNEDKPQATESGKTL